MKLRFRYGNYVFANINIFLVILFSYLMFSTNDLYVKNIQAVLTLVSVVLIVLHIGKIYGSIINFHSVVIMSFYVFFLGRQLTSLFGFESYHATNYGGSYTVYDYGFAFFFSYCCIFIFYVFSIMQYYPDRIIYQDEGAETKLYKILQRVFWICFIPMVYYYYTLLTSALISKYGSDMYDSLVSGSRYIISLLRQWGVLSLVGIVVLKFTGSINTSSIYFVAYGLLTVVSLFSGGRTEGMSLLLTIVLLYSEKNKGLQRKQVIAIALGVLVSILAPYLFAVRKDIKQIGSIRVNDFVNSASVLIAIHEMGGTAAPFLLIKKLDEQVYGQSYFLAIMNTLFNFLPAFARPDFSFIGPPSLAHHFTVVLGLNYGLGFNLVAEAYYNFAFLGILVFAVFGIVFKNIISKENTSLEFVKKVLFVFLLFTMARRESKDLFTSMLYYWIPFVILINIVKRRSIQEEKV